jgi:hypothetical protein
MTEAELKKFAERIYNFPHWAMSIDFRRDIAFYILDLLKQGYTVKGILAKLKECEQVCRSQLDYRMDMFNMFHRAIRRLQTAQEYVWFYEHGPGSQQNKVA